MSKEGMEKGLHHESYGLKGLGIALIVSIFIIILLLLFAGLESAAANPGAVEEAVAAGGATRQGAERLPALGPGLDGGNEMESRHPGAEKDPATVLLKTDPPQGRSHEKIFGGGAKTVSPSEMLTILGFILLLMALLLSRDRKE